MVPSQRDTIAALATPQGDGAISIVRLSGANAHAIACAAFRPARAGALVPRRLTLGHVVGQAGEFIDQAMCVLFPAPATYTGEPMAEIHAHGGRRNAAQALVACLERGARQAEAGEFARRALENGKIDLSQAEATARLIEARTRRQARVAAAQLDGALGSALRALRDELVGVLAAVEACLDFPEEIEEDAAMRGAEATLEGALARMREALEGADAARHVAEGVRIALCGLPNAGKSTLFNRLLGRERAIVTEHAGTTRDTIEEPGQIDGVPVVWIDMAGLRETEDPVERIGVARAREQIGGADVVIWLEEPSADAAEARAEWDAVTARAQGPIVSVRTKADRDAGDDRRSGGGGARVDRAIAISAHTGEGIDALFDRLREALHLVAFEPDIWLSERRHVEAMRRAEAATRQSVDAWRGGEPIDMVAIGVRDALDALADCLGENASEAVIDQVFARFCVGK